MNKSTMEDDSQWPVAAAKPAFEAALAKMVKDRKFRECCDVGSKKISASEIFFMCPR